MKQVMTGLVGAIASAIAIAPAHGQVLLDRAGARQCVVVIAKSWSSTNGTMTTFEREATHSAWVRRSADVPVVLGKGGLGWGLGLTEINSANEPTKKEGDNKAPAGVFVLRGVFGYAPTAQTRMPYVQASPDLVCVDDPQSRHYNQLIDRSKTANPDWHSAEQMLRGDVLYKWGVIVDHNVMLPYAPFLSIFRGSLAEWRKKVPQPAGSCIFLHVWRSPTTPTVGCTAMAEENIVDLIHWLDPHKQPVLAQMPALAYETYQHRWNLPRLE